MRVRDEYVSINQRVLYEAKPRDISFEDLSVWAYSRKDFLWFTVAPAWSIFVTKPAYLPYLPRYVPR